MNQAILTLSRQPDARRAPRYLDALRDTLWFLLAWALLIGAWELAVQSGWLDGRVLPPPSVTLPYAFSGEAVVGFGQQRSASR
jgi:ABC-type nitrate/sulfonate/bicarbonate transport system permease component